MSAWRITVMGLHRIGGRGTSREVEMAIGGAVEASASLTWAAYRGLVKSPGRLGKMECGIWELTPLGRDWCEGRVVDVKGPHPLEYRRWSNRGKVRGAPRPRGPKGRGMWFIATWLSSLPRDIRIQQPEKPVVKAPERELEPA